MQPGTQKEEAEFRLRKRFTELTESEEKFRSLLSNVKDIGSLKIVDFYLEHKQFTPKQLSKLDIASQSIRKPYIELAGHHPFEKLNISISKTSDQNQIITDICKEMTNITVETRKLFEQAILNADDFSNFFIERGMNLPGDDPSGSPMQRIIRYNEILRAMLKDVKEINAISPNTIRSETVTVLEKAFKEVEKFASEINEKQREMYKDNAAKLFSADPKTAKLLIDHGIVLTKNLTQKQKKEAANEIASVIKNGQPKDIVVVLQKYNFSIDTSDSEKTFKAATAIKTDFYLNQINDPTLRGAIEKTGVNIHAKPGSAIRVQARFHGYRSTTQYIINEINKARIEEKSRGDKKLGQYLLMLGLEPNQVIDVLISISIQAPGSKKETEFVAARTVSSSLRATPHKPPSAVPPPPPKKPAPPPPLPPPKRPAPPPPPPPRAQSGSKPVGDKVAGSVKAPPLPSVPSPKKPVALPPRVLQSDFKKPGLQRSPELVKKEVKRTEEQKKTILRPLGGLRSR